MNFDKSKEYTGIVEWFNNKGFGVAKVDDSDMEVFVHHSKIITTSKNYIKLVEKEKIKFHIGHDKNKLCALQVKSVEDKFVFETKNFQPKKKFKKVKNTETFEPSHEPVDMRVIVASGKEEHYPRVHASNDIIIVNDLFCDSKDLSIYNKLLEEIKNSGVSEDKLWKLWHGDTHIIADDKKNWKKSCPTFNYVIDKVKKYFKMDVKATRFNWYQDSSQWKPFHHDAAAVKPDKAKTQNITVGISFGSERDAAFEHAKTRTKVSVPLPNGSIYVFNKDVNIEWRHGILQVPPERQHNEGRISIIAWGKVDMGGKL